MSIEDLEQLDDLLESYKKTVCESAKVDELRTEVESEISRIVQSGIL